jgi:hypothetical protein
MTGGMDTIWECRYESGIPKKKKVFEFGLVYIIITFESSNFLQILCETVEKVQKWRF